MLFYRNCLGFQDFAIQQRENSIFSSNANQEIVLQKKGGTAEKFLTTPQPRKQTGQEAGSLSSTQRKAISG